MSHTSEFIRRMTEREFMHQCTDLDALDSEAAKKSVVSYVGYDCTATSLHVGSLVSIMMLRHFQQSGHKPIVLMGGGTTKVGDPSGKDEQRKLLTDADIQANMDGIKNVFSQFLTFGDGPTDAVMVNNDDWLKGLQYIDFLRDFGRHFSVNRMLSFDSVKLRLDREQPLSFLEFNYMILQAYDFLELNRRYDCSLQMGGSDQWGNIINGVELARRVDGAQCFGLTCPLITTSSGAKMGKTAAGAVWLNADLTSPYEYWQFWRNTEDGDVGRFMRLFTEIPLDAIAGYENLDGSELNEAKKILATAATALLHGQDAADQAAETARKTFEEGGSSGDLPSVDVDPETFDGEGALVYELLVKAGLCNSNSEARRLIKGGGARVNDQSVAQDTAKIDKNSFTAEGFVKLSAGKKRHVLVRLAT